MKYLFLICSLLLCSQFSFAQAPSPVSWKFSAVKVKKKVYKLVLEAKVEEGWSIYSQDLPDGGPIPTEMTLEENALVTKLGDLEEKGKVIEVYDEMFDMQIKKYKKKVVFEQTVKIKKKTQVKGVITFMACDSNTCLPPTDVDFSFKLK